MHYRILTFAPEGEGKSALFASIVHYIYNSPDLALRQNTRSPHTMALVRDWLERLSEGKFPQKTAQQVFMEIQIAYIEAGSSTQNALTFYEVSGERVAELDPGHENHGARSKQLDTWLLDCSLILLVASARPANYRRGGAYHRFLDYLLMSEVRTPVGLVLSHWDLVEDSGMSPRDVAFQHYPAVTNLLTTGFPGRQFICPFSVGDVRVDPEGEPRIDRLRTTEYVPLILHQLAILGGV